MLLKVCDSSVQLTEERGEGEEGREVGKKEGEKREGADTCQERREEEGRGGRRREEEGGGGGHMRTIVVHLSVKLCL